MSYIWQDGQVITSEKLNNINNVKVIEMILDEDEGYYYYPQGVSNSTLLQDFNNNIVIVLKFIQSYLYVTKVSLSEMYALGFEYYQGSPRLVTAFNGANEMWTLRLIDLSGGK